MPSTKSVRGKRMHSSNDRLRLDQLSEEDAKTYHSIVEDFDRQWENHQKTIKASGEGFNKMIMDYANLQILKLPKKERDMPASEFLSHFKKDDENVDPNSKVNNIDDVSKVKKPAKVSTDSIAEVDQQIDIAKADLKSAKKSAARKKASARKAKTPALGAEMLPPVSSTVRRSTRKRLPVNRDLATPLNSIRSTVKTGMKTPLITPKFDIRTPLNRSVMRLAKPNETLVSLSGSPVIAGESTVKRGRRTAKDDHVPIRLGKGKTVVVPIDEDVGESLELDENEREKLEKLRSNIDTMLNM